jgi:hypothetical protein
MPSFIKTSPVGAEFFRAHGQTGMAKLIVAFHSFASAPKDKFEASLWFCDVRGYEWGK